MPVRMSVNISLSPERLAVAEGLISTGRYETISEGMRAAQRVLEEREIDFRAHKDSRQPGLSSPVLEAAEAPC